MGQDTHNNILNLLDQAYAVVDDPNEYSDFMEGANVYFFEEQARALISKKLPDFADIDNSIERHVRRLDGMDVEIDGQSKKGLSIENHAQLHLSLSGHILSANSQADTLFETEVKGYIDQLPLAPASIETLREIMREIKAGVEVINKVVHLKIENDKLRSAFAYYSSEPLDDGQVGLHISLSYFEWTPAIFAAIATSLKLSDSESFVLQASLKGLTRSEIAQERGRSLETIRSQAQSVLRKASCSNMQELTHLCTSIAYVVGLAELQAESDEPDEQWVTPRQNMHILKLDDGREVAYYEYGDPKGTPVMFIHGFFQGPFFLDSMKHGFLNKGFRIIAPSRPYFGYTSASVTNQKFDETSLTDMLSLLEHLEIKEKILVMAHHGGGSHAFRLAHKLADQVCGMLLVGAGIPITPEHVLHMNKQSRMVAMGVRHAPSIVKLMVTIGLKAYKNKKVIELVKETVNYDDFELEDLTGPNISPKIFQGIYHLSEQGSDAFVYDGRTQMSDWSADLASVNCRQIWVQGRHCHVMGAHFIEEYIKSNTNHIIEIMEDAGYNIMHQSSALILDKMVELTNE